MMKSKKRIVSMLTVLAMVLVMVPTMAFADAAEAVKVSVTIADKGELVVTQEEVAVTDIDADGALTINDALYAAHEAEFAGGAAAGYASAMSDWGLSITKLWGDTSGSFGYCVNDASAWSLADPVKDGDDVYAYIYKDQTAWSDKYSFFDQKTLEAAEGEEIELTLSYQDYDENWNKVSKPAANVEITVDGKTTDITTDSEGKAVIKLTAGAHIISAYSDDMILVPAVCTATVSAAPADVTVTISDKGELVLTQEKVTVTDIDADGVLTINDALYAAHEHEDGYEGGAAAGYASAMSDWGLSITKLWGDTSGAFGYYVNDASAWSLADPVKAGDYVNAYIYKDQTAWSDKYSFFNEKEVEVTEGEQVELTLSYMDYDASWNLVTMAAAGMNVTVDGKDAGITDAEGKVVLTLEAGEHIISAYSNDAILVPAVCSVNVKKTVPETPEPEQNEGNDNTGNDGTAGGAEQGEEPDNPAEEPEVENTVTYDGKQEVIEAGGEDEQISDETSDKDAAGTEPEDKAEKSVQTGDDFNMALYGFAALTALAAAAFCLRRKACK